VGDGRDDDRGLRVLRVEGAVLGDAGDVSHRTGGSGGDRWINSIGNLGGPFGPWYVGFMKDATGSYTGGLYGLALFGFAAAAISAFYLDIPNPEVVRTRAAE
jgi:nitrate/nitrite transporter NarK